ncbi:MAG: hypothetical protein MJ166_08605 [Clostridia bacterium]|nr:hypothetical protein [Clostridia bacterium]
MVDVITVLMMVVLLVLMFFVLYFLVNKGDEELDDYNGYNHGGYDYDYNPYDGYDGPSPTPTPTPTPTPVPDQDGGGGGGGGYTEVTTTYIEPDKDDRDRAAIYAVLVDEDTNQHIKIENAIFELFLVGGTKQTLTTHYPTPISYTEFSTTEGGWFYLPEKISKGQYYLHLTNEIPGYDSFVDVYFDVEESYEWSDPLVVEIPLGASKNNFEVQINDLETGVGLEGVIIDVVANGDVRTADGTIRYANGSVVDSITCNEEGFGISSNLYLGDFTLVPRNLPFGYAAPVLEDREVTLTKRVSVEHGVQVTLESGYTTVRMNVSDELDNTIKLKNMAFTLTCDDDPSENRVFVTDGSGSIVITGLNKNATYRLTEETILNGYIANGEVAMFRVDQLGLIESEPVHNIVVSNRIIRVEVGTVDRVLKTPLTGYTINLKDKDGNVVYSWVSDGSTFKINGIEIGVYTLEIERSSDKTIIVVEDVKDIQSFNVNIMTVRSYLILILIALILLLVVLVAALYLVYKIKLTRKNKADQAKSSEGNISDKKSGSKK